MVRWLAQLTPDDCVSSVHDIDLAKLWEAGKRLVLTDLDNTLVPWNAPDVPPALLAWLHGAQSLGFEICIISNNEEPRVAAFARQADLQAVSKARKPKPAAFHQAMQRLGRTPAETVMVGDQLFTDVQGARRAGIDCILVLPLDGREWWPTRIMRQLERFVLWQLVRQGRLVRPRTGTGAKVDRP